MKFCYQKVMWNRGGCGFSKRSVKSLRNLVSVNADYEEKIFFKIIENMAWIFTVFTFFPLNRDHVIKVSTQTFFTVKHNIQP